MFPATDVRGQNGLLEGNHIQPNSYHF